MKQSIAASVIAACFCAAGMTNETFAGGETATATIPLDGETQKTGKRTGKRYLQNATIF